MEYTPIHNRFWSDGWVRSLNALDRYLFLYLLTNGRAKLTGIYELPLDLMASESGIDQRDLQVMLNRLEPKIYYREGWIIIINYPKHQIGGGHKFGQGMKARFDEIPLKIRNLAKGYGYTIDTLSMGYRPFPNRIEENIITTEQEVREVREVREVEEKPYKPDKRVKDKESIFHLWGKEPKVWWKSTAQRKAALNLLDTVGYEQIAKAVSIVKKYRDDTYCPSINTPVQLSEKWESLLDFKERNKII